jgi:predicted Fe-Mo cluster-binding NifX family protein
MKILFTAKGKELDAQMDPRFGRAMGFILYDDKTETYEWYDNSENKDAGHGAGTNTAQTVADLGAEAVVTFHVGDKAQKVLNAVNIDVYSHVENITIKEAIEKFKKGELEKD